MANSFNFPDMIDKYSGSFNSINEKESVKQNLTLLLHSIKTELLGDPYYGTNLQKLLFDPNDIVVKDQVVDEIYMAVRLFIKEITLQRKNIIITVNKKGTIEVSLKILYNKDSTNDLYNIKLVNSEEI